MVRIERALDRIERAAGRHEGAGGELARLRSAHHLLRDRVEGAIGEIDLLLNGTAGAAD